MNECDPQHAALILAAEGPTMFDIDTYWCDRCPLGHPDDMPSDHGWHPATCYSPERVYYPGFKIREWDCCGASEAA